MASSEPILCPSASTTSWPRQSRMFSASNMPAASLTAPRRRLPIVLPGWALASQDAGPAACPPKPGVRLSRGFARRGRRHRPAAAPVLTTGPGQQFLIDEIPPQSREVGIDGGQEPADAVFGVAHPGLEALRDLVEQKAAA